MINSNNKSLTNFQKQAKVFKIIVLGDSFVGKTCLTYRFCERKVLDQPTATIGVDFRERNLNIGREEVKLQFWDTAGQEKFRKSIVGHYYRNVHAVVVVYDITNILSFQNVPVWLDECQQHGVTSEIPHILVGNKCDCVDSLQVSTSLAQRLADSYNMPLFETSALSESEGGNIDAIFITLAHKVIRQQPMMAKQPENLISVYDGTVALQASPSSGSCIRSC